MACHLLANRFRMSFINRYKPLSIQTKWGQQTIKLELHPDGDWNGNGISNTHSHFVWRLVKVRFWVFQLNWWFGKNAAAERINLNAWHSDDPWAHCKMWDDMKNGYVDRRDIDLLIFLALMNTAALCIVVDLRNAHVSFNWQMLGQTSHSLYI